LANIIAIPWVSLVVVPAALAGTLMQLLLDWPWLVQLAAAALNALFAGLDWLAQWRPAERLAFPGGWGFLLGLAGVVALLSPLARLRWMPALACILALAWPPQSRPGPGELWVTVHDVGQGLSVLLQTLERAVP